MSCVPATTCGTHPPHAEAVPGWGYMIQANMTQEQRQAAEEAKLAEKLRKSEEKAAKLVSGV